MNNKLRRGALLAEAVTQGGSTVNGFYNPNPNYLTIVALEDGCEIGFDFFKEVFYSLNGSDEWLPCEDTIYLNKDEYASFKSYEYNGGNEAQFYIYSPVNLTGNCNSMIFGDDAATNFDLTGYDECFTSMFAESSVIEVSPTFLPATTLAFCCYGAMFIGCASLTTAPELPATTLAGECYNSMFSGCSSLTTAPVLPAITLANDCYREMFNFCTSLTTAPSILPATALAEACYFGMFYGCESLTIAPELPATELTPYCYFGMFYGCESLTDAPRLPANTLNTMCYQGMFEVCSNLNYIEMLATDVSARYCLDNWVYGVASSGTFVKNKDATWDVTGVSGVPSGWTVELA